MIFRKILSLAIVLSSLYSLEAANIRPFIPCQDYESISAICSHYWKELGETDESCSTLLEKVLYSVAEYAPNSEYVSIKVVEDDGDVIGYIIYADLQLLAPSVFELTHIAMSPAHQGQGHGGALLEVLKSDAKAQGGTSIVCRIKGGNAAAIAWHKRQGFLILGKDTKAQDCFEVVFAHEAAECGYVAMKLDLQASHSNKRAPKNCITAEVKENIAAGQKKIYVTDPSRQILIEVILTVLFPEPQPPFNHFQLKKIASWYLQRTGVSALKEQAYEYAQFVLGCNKALTSEDKVYLDRVFDAVSKWSNNRKLMGEVMNSLLAEATEIV
jgi:ribosomal protein S18 acetylase RimI-like enzyme